MSAYTIGPAPISINEGYGDKALLIANTGTVTVYLSDVRQSLDGFPLVANAMVSWPADEALYASSSAGGRLTLVRSNAALHV